MTADALVARSLLAAKPSPLALPRARGVDSELDWDEELPDTHWPVDDETLFYAKHVATTRTNSTSGGHRKFFDLNISLPVVLPGSEIRVLNAEGENYYHKPGDAAANVLFCCHESTQQEDEISFDPDTVETFTVVEPLTAQIAHDTAYKTTADTTDPVASISASISTSAPRVCDVWSSFLRIHVGTVHNCHADLIQEITEFFLQTLKSVEFLRPIEIQCAGVFQVKNRYETRAKFVATEDLAQFRVIRRALKKFVLTLRERFSVHHQGPVFDATISPVCKTGASLPIEIRRYSILAPDVAAQVKGKQTLAIADEEIPLTANCYINEVRLEMTHARAVDPRWTDAWVLCRRMPMGPGLTPGRHVFAPGHTPPRVLYQFKHPKAKLLKSRFGPLYMLTESALNLTKKQQVEPTRTDRYEADRHDANGQDVAPGANSAAAAPGANLAGAPLGANLAKAALGANLAGAAPDANLAAAAPGAILAATTIKHEDFSPVKTDFGGMMGTESATLEQENNSNLRAEAVPFFPITALNQVLQSFQAETSSNTTWDRLVESALNHENSQQQTKGLELLRALKNGSFKNQSGTYRRPF
ncbi:hypothetical protein GNI_038350 [Gregarina niphandrodes]|uniref:Uncharacterized protein n=1 Tax=Gregarina niphandrodes TaxID=110365 RepID=A0A023BAH5_GRENI|nr:hypothetical protein GNI_038350 [Gregarina niphandrodes]EZG78298.1 hypothetical protein GNI_038350 [Gregarina niphandrodes]|eukprot:XP_011129354.1 hypothetical protein GNI_038350 [Gregarina niphandrodes]